MIISPGSGRRGRGRQENNPGDRGGSPHTFGNAGPGPSRFIIILPARLDELISQLHASDPAEHPEVYRSYESELLE